MTTTLLDAGRAIIPNRILAAGTEPKFIAWGNGTAAAGAFAGTPNSTTLFTEVSVAFGAATSDRTSGTSSRVTTTITNDTYQVTGTRAATGGGTVTNSGLFDTVGTGGNLFVGADGMNIALLTGDSIAYTWQIKFT